MRMNYCEYSGTSQRYLLGGVLAFVVVYMMAMYKNEEMKANYNSVRLFSRRHPFSTNSDRHICEQLYPNNGTPNLFSRVYADFQPFRQRKILPVDIRQTSVGCSNCHRVQIINNELYVVQRPVVADYETRGRSVAQLIKQVTDRFSGVPNLELFYDVQDFVEPYDVDARFTVPVFGMTKMKEARRGLHADRIILMPCFSFWGFPETRVGRWPQKATSILESAHKSNYESRIPKLFWRGEIKPKRGRLLAEAGKYPNLTDVAVVTWMETNNSVALRPSQMYKTLEEHCHYKYLLHLEGHSYSSRLKYLLLCGSPVIYPVIDHWEEYWHHLLENGSNIIFFSANNSGEVFKETLTYLGDHEEKAKDIGRQGQQLVVDYLSEQAVLCYWWKLLFEYAKLFDYSPTLHPYAVHIDDLLRNKSGTRTTSGQPSLFQSSSFLLFSLIIVHLLLWTSTFLSR